MTRRERVNELMAKYGVTFDFMACIKPGYEEFKERVEAEGLGVAYVQMTGCRTALEAVPEYMRSRYLVDLDAEHKKPASKKPAGKSFAA
jgi:hypothetical protein